MGLNYFGARFYDPVLGVWLSPDPARQFANPYNGMGGDPIMYRDPDGRWVISALKIASGYNFVLAAGGALSAALNADNFWEGTGVFFGEFAATATGDYAAVMLASRSLAVGIGSDIGNVGIASYMAIADGDLDRAGRRFSDFGNATTSAVVAPLMSDYATLSNTGKRIADGDYGEALTTFNQAGVNSSVSSIHSMKYSYNHGFSDQSMDFRGVYYDEYARQSSLLWHDPNATGKSTAEYIGGNVTLKKKYFTSRSNHDTETKFRNWQRSVLYHESIHGRQQSRYGLSLIHI